MASPKEVVNGSVPDLRQKVRLAEVELYRLKAQLADAEQQANSAPASAEVSKSRGSSRWPLSGEEYTRYGRQMILAEVGLPGQLRLKNAKVLIVGVGGLGCPAAAYLAGAGVGTIGLVDGDTVEESNLHRQIAHSTERVGMSKVDSAVAYLSSLNPLVHFDRHASHLTPSWAIKLLSQYDLVLDCTDRPSSRYLISDAAVMTGKPLVSASALKTEGQLVVLNDPPLTPGDLAGGPCYRCIFPKPPPAESVLSCGEGGILGPVVGMMGVLQALEAVKIIVTGISTTEPGYATDAATPAEPPKSTLLMFSAYSQPQFRSVRLRTRRKDCAACSASATISMESLSSGSLDYDAFCGTLVPVRLLPSDARISAVGLARLLKDENGKIIDVRDEIQYGMCALPNSINIPWTGDKSSWATSAAANEEIKSSNGPFYIVCRLGNDSQLAVKAMREHTALTSNVRDVKGGFQAWRETIDPEWPDY